MRADVVVVGAGPAGSVTALLLARAGFHVVLLDRQSFPRAKPCGDCLSPQVTRQLRDLELLTDVLALAPARLDGWRIIGPDCASFEGRFADVSQGDATVDSALALPRARLDAVLLEAARRAGAEVQTGFRVTDIMTPCAVMAVRPDRSRARFDARLVVGADGLRSVVARRLGLTARRPRLRKLSLTAHMRGAELDTQLGEMHVGPGFCAGVAPVTPPPEPTCNVTVVARAGTFARRVREDARAFFHETLERLPHLRGRFEHAQILHDGDPDGPGLLASGPFDVPMRSIVRPGFALAGDAAGYYDPFTGQGIHQAIAGARLLAEAAEPWLHRRAADVVPALRDYERRQRALTRGPRLLQRIIEAVLSRSWLAEAAIARLGSRPVVGRALLAATGDLVSAWSVFSPAVLLAFAGPSRFAQP